MKEKKIFILAVPTIIIIVIAIVGISLIFYSRNFKKMSKEDVKLLAQKVVKIENISCEVITTTDKEASIQSVEDYKLKNGVMISKVDDFVIYDNKETQTLMQIDDEEKLVYTYGKYNSEIDNFKTMLLTAESLLMNDKNEYIFKDFVTMNGIKCINFELKNNDTIFEIWMDKKTGMIVKMDTHYGTGDSQMNISAVYRYQIDNVKDEDIAMPNTTGYKVINL